MIRGSTRQHRSRWDGKGELFVRTSKPELRLKIMCKNPVLSHRKHTAFPLQKSENNSCLFSEPYETHVCILFKKELCDFYFNVFKEIYFSLCFRILHKRGEYLWMRIFNLVRYRPLWSASSSSGAMTGKNTWYLQDMSQSWSGRVDEMKQKISLFPLFVR
jgi:hypothetical protein